MPKKSGDRLIVVKNWPCLVVGCIIEHQDKFILVQERMSDIGKWNQPAGWLEKYENPVIAAKREAEEETGLKVKIIGFLGAYSHIKYNVKKFDPKHNRPSKINIHAVKLIFIGKSVENPINKAGYSSKEISDTRWFTLPQIKELDKSKLLRDHDIINEVQDYRRGRHYNLNIVQHRSFFVK